MGIVDFIHVDFEYIQKIFETSKKLSAVPMTPFVIVGPAGFYTGHRSTSVFFPFDNNFLQGRIETAPVLAALKKLKKHKPQKITLAAVMQDKKAYLQILCKNAKMNFPMEGYVNSEDEKDNMPGSMFPELCEVLVKQRDIPFFAPPKYFWPALDAAAEYMVKSSDTSYYSPANIINVSNGMMASMDGYRGYLNKNFEECPDCQLRSYNLPFVKSLGMDQYFMYPVEKGVGTAEATILWANEDGVVMHCVEPINTWDNWPFQLNKRINDANFAHRIKLNQKEALEALDMCSINMPEKTKKDSNPYVTVKAQVNHDRAVLSSTNGVTSTEVGISAESNAPCIFGAKEEYLQDMMKKTAEFEVTDDSLSIRFPYHSGTVFMMCTILPKEEDQ